MSDRRNTAKWARSSSTSSDWLSAMRVPRRESAVELSYAVHRIENLQRQMPMLGLALFCFGLFLAFQNWPFTHFTSLTWIAANLLASVVVFWAGTSLTKWLYANPVRAVKLIGSGAAIIGLMLGSTAGLLDSSPGIAAIVTGAIIGMMIFAALPLAQLVFLIGFLLGELLFGGLQLPALMISGAGALICTGTWLSAHFSIHRIEGELALQEEKLERFAGQNDSIRWAADTDGMLAQTSLAAFKSHGLMAENTMSFSIFGLAARREGEISTELQTENALCIKALKHRLATQRAFADLSVSVPGRDGVHRLSISGSPQYDMSGDFIGFAGVAIDLTENVKKQEKLATAAVRDALTGLTNRASFNEQLEQALASKSTTALILIDLDKFKQANDTLGHQVGDQLLCQFSERLRKFIGDDGCAARLGGDEFGVYLHEISARAKVEEVAKALIPYLSAPYDIDGLTVTIGATIGIAIAPEHGNMVDALVRSADLALYAAKARGGNQYRFFDTFLLEHALERRRLEIDLKKAIKNGELDVIYQPIVDTKTERLCGFEALCCWEHPKRGVVSPDEFIPLAEVSGFINQLGEWVLRKACATAAGWPSNIRLSVNLSPTQFKNPNLTAIVTSSLAQSQLPPDRLELEITEGVFLNATEESEAILRQLRDLGVHWAMDDFGTGYSSLKYLLNSSFQKIKIDREFVNGVSVDGSQKRAIAATIVALADNLGMETTAEGVEAKKDLEVIKAIGCTQVQGFIYGPKLTEAEANSLAKSRLPIPAEGYEATRREPRTVVFRSADIVHGDETLSGTVRNISPGGAMVESDWKAVVGERVEIRMDHEKPRTGMIRWADGKRFGVQFDAEAKSEQPPARSAAA